MPDLLCVGAVALFFLVSWKLVRVLEREER